MCKDPNGENLFPQSNEVPTGLGTCDEMREIATLQRRLKTLEAQLTFYNDVSRDIMYNVTVHIPTAFLYLYHRQEKWRLTYHQMQTQGTNICYHIIKK